MPSVAREARPNSRRRESQVPGGPVILEARVVTDSGGGPDKTILNSPRFLTSAGYHTICAYMHPPADPGFEQLRLRAQACRAPLHSIPDRGPFDWRVAVELLRICRAERVSIWHGHDYKSNALGLLLRRFWPMRLITTVHGWDKDTRRAQLYFAIDRLCLPYYERVICVSDDLRDQCLACGVPADNCALIENAIDPESYSRKRSIADAKKAFGFSPERFLIGAVGRLSSEKGFDVLIRSVNSLLKAGLPVDLAIAGEGDQRPHLEALVGELGCGNYVRLLGYQRDPLAVFEALDVYALSSFHEGLPNVLLEAMALEVPVVATRVGGVGRLIRHEENGLLVEPRVVEDLALALTRMLDDPGLRARCRRAGRITVETAYSFEGRMRKMGELYDALLGRQRRGGAKGLPPRHRTNPCGDR